MSAHEIDGASIGGDILDGIRECIADVVGVSPVEIELATTLDELGADSFHVVDVALRLEEYFGVDLPPVYAASRQIAVMDYVAAVVAALSASGTDLEAALSGR